MVNMAVHTFKKLHLDKYYWSEGANFGDLNKDGFKDAVSGPYWWEGPDFTKRHEIYEPKTTFALKKDDGTEEHIPGFEGALGKKNAYSTDNFFSFVYDLNRDGYLSSYELGRPAPQRNGGVTWSWRWTACCGARSAPPGSAAPRRAACCFRTRSTTASWSG